MNVEYPLRRNASSSFGVSRGLLSPMTWGSGGGGTKPGGNGGPDGRAGFLAAGFLAAGFLAAGFLAAGFLAAGFLAAGFLAAGFLAAGFLAAGWAWIGAANNPISARLTQATVQAAIPPRWGGFWLTPECLTTDSPFHHTASGHVLTTELNGHRENRLAASQNSVKEWDLPPAPTRDRHPDQEAHVTRDRSTTRVARRVP